VGRRSIQAVRSGKYVYPVCPVYPVCSVKKRRSIPSGKRVKSFASAWGGDGSQNNQPIVFRIEFPYIVLAFAAHAGFMGESLSWMFVMY
jgi:hypothetical protein